LDPQGNSAAGTIPVSKKRRYTSLRDELKETKEPVIGKDSKIQIYCGRC
jgi:hypothetical protein